MDRDPILFAWRSARRQHATATASAIGIGLPFALLALLSLRDLIGVLTPSDRDAAAFLSIVMPLPGRAGALTLWPGWALDSNQTSLAALLGLAASALVFAGLGWVVGRLCFSAQTRAAGRLRATATDAILRSPAGAREDLRALPALVGQALSGAGVLMATGILVPAMTLGALVLALFVAGLAAPRLVPATAIALLAAGLARLLLMRRAAARTLLRARERDAAQAGLMDLIQRMPAVRVHGAAPFERRRLGLRALAARGTLGRSEAALAYARAPAFALVVLLPAILVATALWHDAGARIERISPGALLAAVGAFALAATLVAACLRLWFVREEVAPTIRAIAQTIEGLAPRPTGPGQRGTAFPDAGDLVARDAGAYDAASGERLNGVTLTLPMPAHVAIVGERGSGARALAALLAGQIEPTAGSVSYGGVEMRGLDPVERAHRIAFAGSEAILIDGSLKQNLLYGARPDDREALDVKSRIAMLGLTGLDRFVYARGLDGTVDPGSAPSIASAVVTARRAVRTALAAEGISRLVEPFDPQRYNHQATVGENILFGEALKPAFAQERLASHPYLRAVLEAEDLTQAFIEMGLTIARSTAEIFADLPDDHPLFDAFSLFPARERGFFEDLIARQPEAKGWRRGLAGQRDRERLIGVALRYSETRHRFGLIDEAFEERIVDARRSFVTLLPPKFRETVEFYDPNRLTAAASLEENVLFGRIANGEAGAETRVRALVRRVLAEQGLEPVVYRLGLASRIQSDATGSGLPRRAALGDGAIGARERIAIDLIRCLVRRPDLLVVALPTDGLRSDDIRERVERLRALRQGQGLIVCLPDANSLSEHARFDAVITVERNAVVSSADPAPVRVLEPVG